MHKDSLSLSGVWSRHIGGKHIDEMARHLLAGVPVPVPASDGRRAIALIEAAGPSARSNREAAVTI